MKNKKGFTLIEVILSIAIIGIIAIFVVTIFGSGFRNIINSGKRTQEVFELESLINEGISGDYDAIEGDNVKIVETEVNIPIPGIEAKPIKGKMVTIPSKDQSNMEITTFIPDKADETQD